VIRVLLADDQVLVRAGFRLLLESASDIAVIGEAANGGVAVALRHRTGPALAPVSCESRVWVSGGSGNGGRRR